MSQQHLQLRLSDFDKVEKIGEGTFGKVYKAEYKDPLTGEIRYYALKKLNMIMDEMTDQGFPLTALREIKYLSTLDHENIVAIRQVIHSKPSAKNKMRGSYFLLFDYLNFDLTGMTDKKIKFSVPQIKCIMQQLLRGLCYLHNERNLAHRDIKGANILLSRTGQVQIADFGLARMLSPNNPHKQYTTRVVTLWYRAPELLLGFRNYNFGVDVWSMACVFAELVTGQVLFRAAQEAEACQMMFSICGTPTEQTMPGSTRLRSYFNLVREQGQERKLKAHLNAQLLKNHLITSIPDGKNVSETLSEHWFDLIDKMLLLDPKKRLTAEQALQHPFFTDQSLPEACRPAELPVNQMEDHHEFITKAERNKKKDFRKQFTFRHNLDQTNYNNVQHQQQQQHYSGAQAGSNGSINDNKHLGYHQRGEHSFWKATLATAASSVAQQHSSSAPAYNSTSSGHQNSNSGGSYNQHGHHTSSGWKQEGGTYQKPLPPPGYHRSGSGGRPAPPLASTSTSKDWPQPGRRANDDQYATQIKDLESAANNQLKTTSSSAVSAAAAVTNSESGTSAVSGGRGGGPPPPQGSSSSPPSGSGSRPPYQHHQQSSRPGHPYYSRGGPTSYGGSRGWNNQPQSQQHPNSFQQYHQPAPQRSYDHHHHSSGGGYHHHRSSRDVPPPLPPYHSSKTGSSEKSSTSAQFYRQQAGQQPPLEDHQQVAGHGSRHSQHSSATSYGGSKGNKEEAMMDQSSESRAAITTAARGGEDRVGSESGKYSAGHHHQKQPYHHHQHQQQRGSYYALRRSRSRSRSPPPQRSRSPPQHHRLASQGSQPPPSSSSRPKASPTTNMSQARQLQSANTAHRGASNSPAQSTTTRKVESEPGEHLRHASKKSGAAAEGGGASDMIKQALKRAEQTTENFTTGPEKQQPHQGGQPVTTASASTSFQPFTIGGGSSGSVSRSKPGDAPYPQHMQHRGTSRERAGPGIGEPSGTGYPAATTMTSSRYNHYHHHRGSSSGNDYHHRYDRGNNYPGAAHPQSEAAPPTYHNSHHHHQRADYHHNNHHHLRTTADYQQSHHSGGHYSGNKAPNASSSYTSSGYTSNRDRRHYSEYRQQRQHYGTGGANTSANSAVTSSNNRQQQQQYSSTTNHAPSTNSAASASHNHGGPSV